MNRVVAQQELERQNFRVRGSGGDAVFRPATRWLRPPFPVTVRLTQGIMTPHPPRLRFPVTVRLTQGIMRPWILTRSARGCVDVGDAPTNALARHSKTPACYITTWAPGEAGGRARHFVFQVHPWEKAADWTARSRNKTFSAMLTTKTR